MSLDLTQMLIHGTAGAIEIALLDGRNDQIMFRKGMVIVRGAVRAGPQQPPDHRTAHRVQCIEKRQQQSIVGCLGNAAVKLVISRFILPPGARPVCPLDTAMHGLHMT